MPEEGGTAVGRLEQISEQLVAAAGRLRDADASSEDVARLAGECAELASQAVAELDRLARGVVQDAAPGQEELL
jgi:hypothetical protein